MKLTKEQIANIANGVVVVTEENGVYSYEIPEGTTAYLFETCVAPTFGQSTNIVFTNPDGDYQ